MPERVRVQVDGGQWEILGVDRHRGITPEGLAPTWNAQGPDGLTFTLRRDPTIIQPDIAAFTPIEYMPDGERVTWSGFTIDTPGAGGDDAAITVNALGWQYHLDDDTYNALFVHEDLTAWQDLRQRLEADLSRVGTAAAATQVADGGIVLGWPKGAVLGGGTPWSAVLLDCGEDPAGWAAAVSIDYVKNSIVAAGQYDLLVRNNNSPNIASSGVDFEDALTRSATEANGAYANIDATFTTRRRYIALLIFARHAGLTTAEDELWQITGVRVFGSTAYRAAGASILKASDVLRDIITGGRAPLLSADTSLIASTTLNLRHFTMAEETPRAAGDRVNGYHVYRLKVDHQRRLVFQPQPSRPSLIVDLAKPGATFSDATTNSGRTIYNKVVATGRTGAGQPIRVVRYSGNVYASRVKAAAQAITNAGAEAGLTGWTSAGALTNPTTPAHAGTHSVAVAPVTSEVLAQATGPDFMPGVTYRFDIWAQYVGGSGARYTLRAGRLGVDQSSASTPAVAGAGTWEMFSVTWTPTVQTPASQVQVGVTAAGYVPPGSRIALVAPTNVYYDDAAVSIVIATVPDRRGFRRTYKLTVEAPTDPIAMAALGDSFLRLHATTPLAGELVISSDSAVRDITTGAPVPLGDLGVYTGEIILLDGLIDPDTGDLARGAIIKTVARNGDTATIALDNERANFQGLLARMGT